MRLVEGKREGIPVIIVSEEGPPIIFGTFNQFPLHRVVVAVGQDGPNLFVTQFGCTSEGMAEQEPFLLPLFVPFIGKQVGVGLDKGCHLIFARRHNDLVRMIGHRTQGQDAHAPLPGLAAVDGEIDQVIVNGIEDNTFVTGSLEHMMRFAGVHFSFFHAFFVWQDKR